MWKNPKLKKFTAEGLLTIAVQNLMSGDFSTKSFPPRVGNAPERAYGILSSLFITLQKTKQDRDLMVALGNQVEGIIETIEKERNWEIVSDLWRVADSLGCFPDQVFFNFAIATVRLIHIFVGSEKRFLIGTRHNQPVWDSYDIPMDEFSVDKLIKLFPVDTNIRYFDKSDLDILPKPGEWAIEEEIPNLPPIQNCWAEVASLLEHAYYNQQFVPHPEGSHIKLSGIPGIDSLVIKAKRGLDDRNYLDFVAVFRFGFKKFVVVLNGSRGVQGLDNDLGELTELGSLATESDKIRFLLWLTALIYHDLVTASNKTSLKRKAAFGAMPSIPAPSPEIGWVYIPRTYRKKVQEARIVVKTPRSMSPHRVSGHKRRGKMTDRQRDLVKDFEEETGLRVFNWLPEGYTFVRPHMVPSEGSDRIRELPRFIRTKIQKELRELLEN